MSNKVIIELLPNEIFVECFQYLNAPDIFYSFNRLNYRFHTLIRNSPLSLNFQQFKKSLFDDFCQTILSNPDIKQNIITLQLSNVGTFEQIQSFLSLFSLNEFIHLRSLSLIKMNLDNTKQVLPMLPFLYDLHYFFCTRLWPSSVKITPVVLKSNIRMITVPQFNFNSATIYETMSLTLLTIYNCNLSDLCQLFKYTPMLKYLKIERFSKSEIKDNELNFINVNIVHLNHLIMNYSEAKFQALELLLKRTPNLKIFSISAPVEMEMVDADRWQHLIDTSLPHLHVFKFKFGYIARDSSDDKLSKLRKFQTDFWHKQHHWYTNYEIDKLCASVYTIPYINHGYQLKSTTNRYLNPFTSNSNEFDNVKNLSLVPRVVRNDSTYYFRNIQLLTLSTELDDDDDDEEKTHECDFSETQIKFLNMIVNVSSIKHLRIQDPCHISSSLLLKILEKLPNVSSLSIKKRTLVSFFENGELCECLNKRITTLDISSYYHYRYIKSNQIDLLCKTFSNLEQLHCYIKNVDDLLLLLGKFPKLSMIKLEEISKDIYSWIQINESTLNVYIDFTEID